MKLLQEKLFEVVFFIILSINKDVSKYQIILKVFCNL